MLIKLRFIAENKLLESDVGEVVIRADEAVKTKTGKPNPLPPEKKKRQPDFPIVAF